MKIHPECWPFTLNGEPKRPEIGLAFTAGGHVLPCCYLDKPHNYKNNVKNLWDEELKIENNESIEDIVRSPQWKKFHKNLLHQPGNSCFECLTHCGDVEAKAVGEKLLKEINTKRRD